MIRNIIRSNKSLPEKTRIVVLRLRRYFYILLTKVIPFEPRFVESRLFAFEAPITEEMVGELTLEEKEAILQEANHIISNSYQSISGQRIQIEDPIDWSRDYVFGYQWETMHYSRYVLKQRGAGTDVKNVWEMSRFYHLVILAKAYCLTGNDEYVEKLLFDLFDWNRSNRFNHSVNWTVAMEVSIRMINILQSIYLVSDSNLLCANTMAEINLMLYKHFVYIRNNLEKGLNTNNHYISNLVGLVWGGIYFRSSPVGKGARHWLRFALRQLEIELGYQVYEDGFSYEDSVSYHAFNTEMVLLTLSTLQNNQIAVSPSLRNTAERMIQALNSVIIGDNIPIIGDIDNGRLLPISVLANRDKTNFGYLISYARSILGSSVDPKIESPVRLPDAGLYRVFNETFDMIIRCGKIGVNGLGGHAHNDQLSFVLYVGGSLFFTDPGTGFYSGDYDVRRVLRSTESHNTLSIEGYEQNDIDFDLFKMRSRTNSEVTSVTKESFSGKHYGFVESLGIIHKRDISLYGERVEIIDRVNQLPANKCFLNFVLHPDVEVDLSDNILRLRRGNLNVDLWVEGGEISTKNDQLLSESYGHLTVTSKVRVLLKQPVARTVISVAGFDES